MKKIIFLLLAFCLNDYTFAQFNHGDDAFNDAYVNLRSMGGKHIFPGRGKAITRFTKDRIIVAGDTVNMVLVSRIYQDGSLDPSFDDNLNAADGLGKYNIGSSATVTSVAVDQLNNRIYVAGFCNGSVTTPIPYSAFILGLNANGSLITGFGTNGIVLFDMATTTREKFFDIKIQYRHLTPAKL